MCSNLKLKLKYSLSNALLHYHKILYITQLDFSRKMKALILWVKNIMLGLYYSSVAEFFDLNIQDHSLESQNSTHTPIHRNIYGGGGGGVGFNGII